MDDLVPDGYRKARRSCPVVRTIGLPAPYPEAIELPEKPPHPNTATAMAVKGIKIDTQANAITP